MTHIQSVIELLLWPFMIILSYKLILIAIKKFEKTQNPVQENTEEKD